MVILETAVNVLISPFTIMWGWLLHNILTPFLLLFALILFFGSQYLLIKIYIFIIKYFIVTLIKIFNFVMQSKKIKSFVENLEDNLIKFN